MHLKLSNLLWLLSFSTRKHMSVASRTILSNFFEEQCPQSHPQYLSGLLRALFPTTFLEIAVCSNEMKKSETLAVYTFLFFQFSFTFFLGLDRITTGVFLRYF